MRTTILIALIAGLAICGCNKKPEAGGAGAPKGVNAAQVYESVHASLGKELLDAVASGSNADAMLVKHSAEIGKLVEATRSEECDFGVDYSAGLETMLPHLGHMRGLARVLEADAARLLAKGDSDEAAKRVAAIMRLSTHVAAKGQTIMELLTSVAIAQMGATFVNENEAIARAAWKTDIQQAIAMVEQSGMLNAAAIVHRDGENVLKTLREGKMMDLSAFGGRDWSKTTQAERDEAAKKLSVLLAEADKAWGSPDAVAKLKVLSERAKKDSVGDLFWVDGRVKTAMNEVQKAIGKASTVLSK